MITNRFWILLAKQASEEISAEEEKELRELLSLYPDYYIVLEVLDGLQPDFDFSVPKITKEKFTEEGWKKLAASLSADDTSIPLAEETPDLPEGIYPFSDTRRKWAGPLLKWAAVILVLMMIGGGIFWWKRPLTGETAGEARAVPADSGNVATNNTIITKKGSRTNIELPDGSKVSLRGSSHLTYADGFLEDNRKVFLEGEAFFDIKKDPGHPFIIQTDQIIIRVLGTAFNVRAYTKEKKTITTLVRGLIEVQLKKDMNRHIFLHPNEKLTVTEGGLPRLTGDSLLNYKVTAVVPDSVCGTLPVEMSQIKGKLSFKNEPFEEITHKMEHWYGVTIIFETPELKKEILAGAFFENESLQEALSALQLTTSFRYTLKADTVYLRQ